MDILKYEDILNIIEISHADARYVIRASINHKFK